MCMQLNVCCCGGIEICWPTQDVCDAVEESDTDKFQDVVAQYDSLTRLDAWKTTLLLRVKKRIPEGEEVSLA